MILKKKPGYLYDDGGEILVGLLVIGFLIYLIIQFWMFAILLILLIFFATGFKKIPTGHKGILLWFGARSDSNYDAGLAWHLPLFSTIEVIDCRVRFIEERNMRVALAYFINVDLKTSVSYRISDPFNYLENYSITDLDGKVKTYINESLRQYLTKNEVTEREIIKMDDSDYKIQQIRKINEGYLQNLGIVITDIVIVIIEINSEMRTFFEILRQADILHEKMSYNEALEKALLINGKVGQTNFNIALKGLTQLKRLTALE
jgi:regulator of protease activity HflC (stomatin/prohibitin superfamily)